MVQICVRYYQPTARVKGKDTTYRVKGKDTTYRVKGKDTTCSEWIYKYLLP